MTTRTAGRATAALGAVAALAGCAAREDAPPAPCAVSQWEQRVRWNDVREVDVLFVLDGSSSMAEEQAALRDAVPSMVGVLASGDLEFGQPEHPQHGVRDFAAIRDLQVGVVSADMGAGGFPQDGCDAPVFGDDGVLLHGGNRAGDPSIDCLPTYDRFLAFENPDGQRCAPDDDGQLPGACTDFTDALACVSALGTDGCHWEQPLEAALKALTPDEPACDAPHCDFFRGTRGHGIDPRTNGGFLRPWSLLAIVVLTDEDDCSAADPALFDPAGPYSGATGIRCAAHPTALHPVERYVEGLLAAREDPQLLVFSVVAGASVPLLRANTDPDTYRQHFDGMLADPSMRPRVDAAGTRLVPSCTSDRGEAAPPRRLVQVARGLESRGAQATVSSICAADYTRALDPVLERIARVLAARCLPRPLARDREGRVPCIMTETLPSRGRRTRCDQVPGRERIGVDDGREVCRVRQLPTSPDMTDPPPAAGWYYDDFTEAIRVECNRFETAQKERYVPGHEPPSGTESHLVCELPVDDPDDDPDAGLGPGAPCVPLGTFHGVPVGDACAALGEEVAPAGALCDPALGECRPRCTRDADCPGDTPCDLARAAQPDRFDALVRPAPAAGTCGDAGLGVPWRPSPDADACASCPPPYRLTIDDAPWPTCARPCATDRDCAHAGAPVGACLPTGVCGLPPICRSLACE